VPARDGTSASGARPHAAWRSSACRRRAPGLADGVRLGAVVPDGAAARAGMREGDIVVRLGDVPVQSFAELRAALQVRRPATPCGIVYLRDGHDRTAQAVLGERPDPLDARRA
jgi:S1-C subfamily serine protease